MTGPEAAPPTDAEALFHPLTRLSGDEDGGVYLQCAAPGCHDGGRPLAYYHSAGWAYPDPGVESVPTVAGLAGHAARHLREAHRG
jgi:hypothetical protein